MTTFFAHSGSPNDARDWQTLVEHSRKVATLASDRATKLGLPRLQTH
jgi:hypothetical protein